jgi:hypothetical protein
MAETRKIKIDVESNADEAAKDFKKVADNIDDSTDRVKQLNKEIKKTDKATDGASGGFKKLSSAAKGIGTALKASGIGLIIGALAGLKAAFESNSETARGFAVVMETISILFSQTVGALVSAAKAAYESTGGFNALGKVLGGILNIALTPLKGGFFAIKLAIENLQLAWEKSFFGDKDPKTIKELRKNIKATEKDLVEVGKSALKSGQDIVDNLYEAGTELVDFGGKAITNIRKISISGAIEQAGALVDARNAAAIAAAEQGVLIEKYDRTAEKLRQVRDEERNSIAERMQANQDLKKVLDDQEKAMLAQATLQIKAAQLEYDKNKTTENHVALLDAQANKQGVIAQIEGLRSEQLANDLALQKEADELIKARTESEVTLSIERQKAEAEFIKEEDRKIQKLIDISKQERELQLARLQEQIDIHKEGTQARLDAEIAYNEQKQALDIQQAQLEEQLRKEQERKDDEMLKKDLEDIKTVNQQKVALAQDSLALISSITELFGQRNERQAKAAFNIDKAAKIASSTIATIEGTIEAWKTAQKSPITAVMPAYPAIQASLTAAFGAAGIAKIAAAKFGGSGGGESSLNSPSGSGGSVMSPNFNVVGSSGMNQLAQIQQQPIQAYVVSGEVTSAQALDRNRIKNATL